MLGFQMVCEILCKMTNKIPGSKEVIKMTEFDQLLQHMLQKSPVKPVN